MVHLLNLSLRVKVLSVVSSPESSVVQASFGCFQ